MTLDIGREQIDGELRAVVGMDLNNLCSADPDTARRCLRVVREIKKRLAPQDFAPTGRLALKSARKRCKYALRHLQ